MRPIHRGTINVEPNLQIPLKQLLTAGLADVRVRLLQLPVLVNQICLPRLRTCSDVLYRTVVPIHHPRQSFTKLLPEHNSMEGGTHDSGGCFSTMSAASTEECNDGAVVPEKRCQHTSSLSSCLIHWFCLSLSCSLILSVFYVLGASPPPSLRHGSPPSFQ